MFSPATLADVPAFCCGHAQDEDAATGCTVVIAPQGATCGVDIRGGGPATRETDLLRPENMIEAVHAVVLAGGSAFGLAASTGVMDELAMRDIGFSVGNARVPIVVGACLFDLLVGKNASPDAAMGRSACADAFARGSQGSLPEGNVGAGCGASVGKLLGGEHAMKAGLGIYGVRWGDLVTCALVAVNACGNVCDTDGTWIAGCRDDHGYVMDPLAAYARATTRSASTAANQPSVDDGGASSASGPCTNTTIGVVLTNARLSKAQTTKVSSTVHDAYARAIKPVHTLNDGDTIFTFASGEVPALPDVVAVSATEAMQRAIVRAATQSLGAYGLPAARDLDPAR